MQAPVRSPVSEAPNRPAGGLFGPAARPLFERVEDEWLYHKDSIGNSDPRVVSSAI